MFYKYLCVHTKLTLGRKHMFMKMGFLCQGNNSSKQWKLMESEIKMVMFSQKTVILRAFTAFFITTAWYLPSIHSLHLPLDCWASGPVAEQTELVQHDINLLKYIITILVTHLMHRGTYVIHFYYPDEWTHPVDDSSWMNILWNKKEKNKGKIWS